MTKTKSIARGLFLIAAVAFPLISVEAQPRVEYKITGTVFDESNQGVEKVRVCALPADYGQMRQMHCGLSDSNGRFVIPVGRPAQYRILPEKSSAGYQFQQQEFYRNPALDLLNVTLTETNSNATISVPLGQKNGALNLRITDATTALAVESVRVLMCHVSNPRVCWNSPFKHSEGIFSVLAPHVPFTLMILADGYEEWWAPDGVGKNNYMSIPPGTKIHLSGTLRRRPETANRPMTEAEKQPLINLPAPVQMSPVDRVELRDYPRHTRLEWQPVEGAIYYMVEIDFCDGRDRELRECVDPKPFSTNRNIGPVRVQGTNYEFNFVGRQPGRWRVWAFDGQGREGFKSPWRVFFYLK
jgi:hypothetical protein